MPNAVVEPVVCSCGTVLTPVEITNPFTGEKRVVAPWTKACPVCMAAEERKRTERAAFKKARLWKNGRHFGMYEYPD